MATEPQTLDETTARQVSGILADRLTSLIDLHLTLKHIHWNVVGSKFIAVHQMLDDHVAEVRAMADTLAERMAALGGVPRGTPAAIVEQRRWPDYKIDRASTQTHLEELDRVYAGMIEDNRRAVAELEQLDLVSQDVLLDQTAKLEQYHWLVTAHLTDEGA